MKNHHILFVCTTCARNSHGSKSGGEKLFEQFQAVHQSWLLRENVSVQPVKCMGVCDRDCAIAFVASGKFTYLFGDLPDDELCLDATVTAVLSCARQYYDHSDGILPYRERPELLRDTIIAKIPPVSSIVV